jgi:tripartite-type tricarboxylate transporter receptor subunit TctC
MLRMESPMAIAMKLRKLFAKFHLAILLPAGATIGACLQAPSAASAQAYPSKPIKLICPIPAGSVVDVTARLVAPALSARLGRPVVIDNRFGGGGTIGVKEFVGAASDGHTLLFSGLFSVFAFRALDYDPIKDFVAISAVASHPWVLVVSPSVPARSVKELIEHAKVNPGKLTWGFGLGSSPHVFGEMFKAAAGIDLANIPYKSGTQAVPDVLGGRIDINFGTASNLLPLIREGKVRALAITSAARNQDLPEVPTMAESGFPQLTRGGWVGVWGPAGTPATVVGRLSAEINATVATPEMKVAMRKLDFEPMVGSPREFATFILDELDAWTPAAKAAGVVPK